MGRGEGNVVGEDERLWSQDGEEWWGLKQPWGQWNKLRAPSECGVSSMSSVECWRIVLELGWGISRGEMIGVGSGEDFGRALRTLREAVLGLVTACTSMEGSKDPMP